MCTILQSSCILVQFRRYDSNAGDRWRACRKIRAMSSLGGPVHADQRLVPAIKPLLRLAPLVAVLIAARMDRGGQQRFRTCTFGLSIALLVSFTMVSFLANC